MIDLRELLALSIAVTIQHPWQPNMAGPWASCSEHTKRKAFDAADNILAALDAAGLVVVPREPTEEMLYGFGDAIQFWMEECGEDADVYRTMLAASPYAKKEVE